jgi:hypothetical protein
MHKPPVNYEQRGKIVFEGMEQTKFWIRSLRLEEDVEHAREAMHFTGPRKWGAIPIVSNMELDNGRFHWVFLVMVHVDLLGILGGEGIIYFCSPEHLKEVEEARDHLADEILGAADTHFDEIIEIEPKKER